MPLSATSDSALTQLRYDVYARRYRFRNSRSVALFDGITDAFGALLSTPVVRVLQRWRWSTGRPLDKAFDDRGAIGYRARYNGPQDAAKKEP